MLRTVPGTVLPWTDGLQQNAFAVLSPVLAVTKGLTLSQLRELTGLEGSTIQNWVKRGWVERPTGKRYGEQQIVRIVIINMLRNSMQLDKIIALISCGVYSFPSILIFLSVPISLLMEITVCSGFATA